MSGLPGVLSTHVGFAGGHIAHPSYKQVCSKQTGHAEVVRVVYDKRVIAFQDLLKQFFALHNPSIDRRENGGQYRSAIFFPNKGSLEEQMAVEMINYAQQKGEVFYTEIRAGVTFYPAEGRHQQYCSTRSIIPAERNGVPLLFWEKELVQ